MANFWDLPKVARQKIYRLHLIHGSEFTGITYSEYVAFCGDPQPPPATKQQNSNNRIMPSLLMVDRKIEREASQIYFGENVFHVWDPQNIYDWMRILWPRHLNSIRDVVMKPWGDWGDPKAGESWSPGFTRLGGLKSLQYLTIQICQLTELQKLLEESRDIMWHESVGYGPQINLQLLNLGGMTGLRTLRGLHVLVILLPYMGLGDFDIDELGYLDEGILRNLVRNELTLSLETNK